MKLDGNRTSSSNAAAFLGVFAQLRRVILASSRLSVRMAQLGPRWMGFRDILYCNVRGGC